MSALDPPWQRALLQGFTTATATLGLLGATALLVLYYTTPHMHRSAVARIVACISVADLVSGLAKSLGRIAVSNGVLCQTQAAFMQFGDLASLLWTLTIALNLLLITYLGHSVNSIQKYERIYAAVCFGIPFISAILPLFLRAIPPNSNQAIRVYGDADLWCWVNHSLPVIRAVMMYIPLCIVFVTNLIVYILVGLRVYKTAALLSKLRSTHTVAPHENAAKAYVSAYVKNTLLYLAAFLFTWTPSIVSRLVTFLSNALSTHLLVHVWRRRYTRLNLSDLVRVNK